MSVAKPIPDVLPRRDLHDLLERLRGLRLAVLGDFTLDGYWYADMRRSQLSRETPLHPRPVVRETYSNGGAANTAWNMAALGLAEVRALGVLGRDWRGQLLEGTLREAGVNTASLVRTSSWLTPFYGKIILTSEAASQEDARLDFVNTQPLPAADEQALLTRLREGLHELHGIATADYQAYGVVTPPVSATLREAAPAHPEKVFTADSRERLEAFEGLTRKPNQVEASALYGGADLEAMLLEAWRLSGRPQFITLGAEGVLSCDGAGVTHIAAAPVRPPLDTVGAGDTFLAACTAALAAGATAVQAGALANLAAGVTVRKLRITGTASPQEIRALYDELYGG